MAKVKVSRVKVEKDRKFARAVAVALAKAERRGWKKPYDVAALIRHAMADEGLTLVNGPRREKGVDWPAKA